MCGIYGIISLGNGTRRSPEVLKRMGDAIVHRGPDDTGPVSEGELLLGMRRLSIIDLAGGHQPIANEDGSSSVVCNGEIYNFRRAARRTAKARDTGSGRTATAKSLSTPTRNTAMRFLEQLDGMFGLALWDRRKRRLVIARDASASSRSIAARTRRTGLRFGGQGHSRAARRPGTARSDSLAQYLSLGYVRAPNSIFAGMRKLEPGTVADCRGGRVRKQGSIGYPPLSTARTEPQWVEAVRYRTGALGARPDGLRRADRCVPERRDRLERRRRVHGRHSAAPGEDLLDRVPWLDRRTLYNELPYARQVAKQFGTDHHEILVNPTSPTCCRS